MFTFAKMARGSVLSQRYAYVMLARAIIRQAEQDRALCERLEKQNRSSAIALDGKRFLENGGFWFENIMLLSNGGY